MLKDYFINQSIKEVEIEEFIRKSFPLGDYSKTELIRTPLGIKIVIHTNKPGRIIGRGGKNINEMTEALKNRFNMENPQLDVKTIDNPNLDAKIVAKQISSALERGYNHKKIGNLTIKRVMRSGAIGVQIIIAGKLGGGKGMISKFSEGYIKHAGQPVEDLVDDGFEEANTRPGKIGVRVRIIKEFIDITGERRNYVHKKKELKQDLGDDGAKKTDAKDEGESKAKPAKAGSKKPSNEKEDSKKTAKKATKKPAASKAKTKPAAKKPKAKKAGNAAKEAKEKSEKKPKK